MQNSNPTNSGTTSSSPPPASSSTAGVSPGEIGSGVLNGLKKASNPLDFIKQNTRPVAQPEKPPHVVTRPGPEMQPSETPPKETVPEFVDPFPEAAIIPPSEAKTEPEPFEDDDEEEVPPVDNEQFMTEEQKAAAKEASKQESLRGLRRQLNEAKQELEKIQGDYTTAQEEIRKFNAGETVPEKLSTLEDRVKHLEHFEQLHAFKLSPEYQEAFAEPMEQLKHQARELAKKYAVDPAKLDQALAIEKAPDRNKFLHAAFRGDSVAALEAREMLEEMEALDAQAFQAEQAPAAEWTRLQNDARVKFEKKADQRIQRIQIVGRSVWTEALRDFNGSDMFPELSFRPNDEKHNGIVKGIHSAAAKEFGAATTELARAGVQDMPPAALKILAKSILLAQASTAIAESRKQHYERAQQLESNTLRRNSLMRPQVGAHSAVSANAPVSKPDSPKAAARELLKHVGIKTG